MNTRLLHANSITGRALRAPVNALLLMLALGAAAALHAQQSDDEPQVGTYSLLYSFGAFGVDACDPEGGLVEDALGNLYGTAGGGQFVYGSVFKVTSGGIETVLHSFAGSPSDGSSPGLESLTLDAAGNLYGTTAAGGEYYGGTVFKVRAKGTESVLYSFCLQSGCADGAAPAAGVVRDGASNLYGTTEFGGAHSHGVVFKLTPGGTESVLHSFGSYPTDGLYPDSKLTRDSSGNLYGTTLKGGSSGFGTVFEAMASGRENVLYSFKGPPLDGAQPGGDLLRDKSGNLYGATVEGGTRITAGVVFKLTSGGTESVLLNFNGTSGGQYPYDGLARDAAGNLYGTTSAGGSESWGVLFGLRTTGEEIVLHEFNPSSSSDGAAPLGGVIRDPSGNLYGTVKYGGAYGCGAVFKFTP